MFPKADRKPQSTLSRHKQNIKNRSKNWGQQKFKPRPYVRSAPPPEPEEAKPWQHVKNEILGDELELRSADRFNMDSDQAKEILKQREKNHRRNVIEAQRNQTTTWEKFGDDDSVSSKAKRQVRIKVNTKDQRDLSDGQRNFVRKKLTRIANRINVKHEDMDMMINDLKNQYCKNPNNKFRN